VETASELSEVQRKRSEIEEDHRQSFERLRLALEELIVSHIEFSGGKENQEKAISAAMAELDDRLQILLNAVRKRIGLSIRQTSDAAGYSVVQSAIDSLIKPSLQGHPKHADGDVFAMIMTVVRRKVADRADKELGRVKKKPITDVNGNVQGIEKRRSRPRRELVAEFNGSGNLNPGLNGLEQGSSLHMLLRLDRIEAKELVCVLTDRIERLPDVHKLILKMRLEGLSEKLIAELLPNFVLPNFQPEGTITRDWVKHKHSQAKNALSLSMRICPKCGEDISAERLPSRCPYCNKNFKDFRALAESLSKGFVGKNE
jgi:hypothetical protein